MNKPIPLLQQLVFPNSLKPFVKEVLFLESKEQELPQSFPFYADGFAGIVFSISKNPFTLQPRDKQLTDFYLYGQTIKPMSLEVQGAFKLVALRLYPFAVRILLGLDPKSLNDDCYDLLKVDSVDSKGTLAKLRRTANPDKIVTILTNYFNDLLKHASLNPDYRIKLATNLILQSKGTIKIKALREKLCIGERTLERHFLKEIGVSPKQFAKIIQFSSSMNQITEKDYVHLTDIGYENGFADQSHFIRTFKRYTGKTPREFQRQIG